MPGNKNSRGRTIANMGVAGAIAFLITAIVMPEFGMEAPQGTGEALTAIIGGILESVRNIGED